METSSQSHELPVLNPHEVTTKVFNEKEFKNQDNHIKQWLFNFKNQAKNTVNFLANLSNDKHKYQGLINTVLERENLGFHEYANGDIYLGEWKDNKRNGSGIYLHNNPKVDQRVTIELFMGNWENDQSHEEGIYVWIEEASKNKDFLKCNFHAYVGTIEKGLFKRGIYLTKSDDKFFIYYGSFKDNKKNDELCYLYDNDFTIDRVFRGKIQEDIVKDGFFVTFHKDDIDDSVFLSFENGVPTKVGTRLSNEPEVTKKIEAECLAFRECLYEDDWFGSIYETAKNNFNIINSFTLEDFNNQKKLDKLYEAAYSYKNIKVYSNLCEKMSK